MQKLKFNYQKFIQNATFYFQAYSGVSGPKKGSILQMQLMEFHLLIEQPQKWKEVKKEVKMVRHKAWQHKTN